MICEICGEGNVSLSKDSEGGIIYFYLLCDSCGAEYADKETFEKNIEWWFKLKHYTFSGEEV